MKNISITEVLNGYIVREINSGHPYGDTFSPTYVFSSVEELAKELPEILKKKPNENLTS